MFDVKVDADGGVTSGDTPAEARVIHVGDIVEIVGDKLRLVVAGNANEGSIADPALTNDMFIVAQSDMTMEYGHVPVEYRDYRYSDTVADSTKVKKVALFRITDVLDVIKTTNKFTTT